MERQRSGGAVYWHVHHLTSTSAKHTSGDNKHVDARVGVGDGVCGCLQAGRGGRSAISGVTTTMACGAQRYTVPRSTSSAVLSSTPKTDARRVPILTENRRYCKAICGGSCTVTATCDHPLGTARGSIAVKRFPTPQRRHLPLRRCSTRLGNRCCTRSRPMPSETLSAYQTA